MFVIRIDLLKELTLFLLLLLLMILCIDFCLLGSILLLLALSLIISYSDIWMWPRSLHMLFSFPLNSGKFFTSFLTHFSFSSELFCFHDLVSLLLLLVSSFNPWWSDRFHGIIPFFLYILKIYVWVCGQF